MEITTKNKNAFVISVAIKPPEFSGDERTFALSHELVLDDWDDFKLGCEFIVKDIIKKILFIRKNEFIKYSADKYFEYNEDK